DKSRMRDAFAVAGLPQPDYRLAWPGDDVGRLATEVGLPCVVKPLSLSASRGVIRADGPEEAVAAAERVRRILACASEDADAPRGLSCSSWPRARSVGCARARCGSASARRSRS